MNLIRTYLVVFRNFSPEVWAEVGRKFIKSPSWSNIYEFGQHLSLQHRHQNGLKLHKNFAIFAFYFIAYRVCSMRIGSQIASCWQFFSYSDVKFVFRILHRPTKWLQIIVSKLEYITIINFRVGIRNWPYGGHSRRVLQSKGWIMLNSARKLKLSLT